MLINTQEMFDDAAALTATRDSTNVIDLLPQGILGATANTIRDIGAGKMLYLHILVTTTLDSAGEAATLDVTLVSDDNTGLSSATTHITIPQIAEAALAAGTWIAKGIPLPSGAYQRYLGLIYTVGTEDFTSGAVSAWLSDTRYDDRTYESGWTTGIN